MRQQQPRKKICSIIALLNAVVFAWFTLKMSENYTAKYELEVVLQTFHRIKHS